MSWLRLEQEAPELARAGRRLLERRGAPIGFLATALAAGPVRLAPVNQISGRATAVTDAAERAAVHGAIRFPVFNREDPVFRLALERALWSLWDGPAERPSQRHTWPERGGGRGKHT